MYCIHCGREIPDNSRLCPLCGLETDLNFQGSENRSSKKRAGLLIGIAAAAAAVFIGTFVIRTASGTVDEPCDWCGKTPSVAYAVENDSDGVSYVCRECSSTCMLCGSKKATKHQENLLGMMLFVCDDCHQDLTY